MNKKVAYLEKKLGWNKTATKDIIKFLKKDVRELKKENIEHKIGDIYFEIIQLANRNGIDLKKTINAHIINTRKKYRK